MIIAGNKKAEIASSEKSAPKAKKPAKKAEKAE